jgi:4-amino-4-deoxy-L-arabinose transferase-like glycosyltransferase
MEGALRPAAPARAAMLVLAAGAAFRLAVAATMPLGLDEAYAVAVARDFSLAFFDHPPLGFWAGVAIPALTGWEHPLAYRLPAVVLGTVTGLAIWRLGALLAGPVAGLWAAALHVLAPHMVMGSGLMVVPDAPMNAALAWLAVLVVRMAQADAAPPLRAWLAAGVLFAVALASKYQAGLAALAVLGWLAVDPVRRAWLATPGPWVGAAVGMAGLLPTVLWNAANGWPSFAFHGARVTFKADPGNLAAMAAGQLAYLLPPVAVLAVLGLAGAGRFGAPGRLLRWLAMVPLAVFAFVFLFGTYTFPHWTMQGWLMALPLAAAWLAGAGARAAARARAWLAGFAALGWGLALLALIHLPTGILTRGMDNPPAWDATVGLFDWRAAVPILAAGGWLDGAELVLSDGWIDAGLMSTALGGALPVRVEGTLAAAHHFAFLPGAAATGRALYLSPGTLAEAPGRLAAGEALAARMGLAVERAGIVTVPRGGRPHAAVAAVRVTIPSPGAATPAPP